MKSKSKPTLPDASKINPAWLRHEMQEFYAFLELTGFPEPVRDGTRGTAFTYPESFIMLLAVLAVKLKLKTYLAIHRFAVANWKILTPDPHLPPISEPQMRMRLKKIRHTPRTPASFIFQLFPETESQYFG
jgi:hypothetical protein